ncbi:uncharacterized protein LOC131071075 [Cryptomeria japonica]|uniref:uncharacterized protein LOC131071075 n=1 Tax=Cryptomeria japonica TaxID=3369 RepID=UPI0027DA20F7|nr:uncharacterized protein LOC131071075 [Cryptomeria japonica]
MGRLFSSARGSTGGLGILWNPQVVKIIPSEMSNYWMVCRVELLMGDLEFPLINVYGPIKTEEKAKVSQDLSLHIQILGNDRVVIAEDFNAILDLDEKNGGLRKSNRIMEDFRDFVNFNEVSDVVSNNGLYTWTNRRLNFSRISKRLDSFRFVKRLHFLEDKIQQWNVASFKNIFVEKLRLEGELTALNETLMNAGMSNQGFEKEKELRESLAEVLRREEIYWRDKYRELWIMLGESNTNFFHSSIKEKHSLNKIAAIRDDGGSWCSSMEEIEKAAVQHFEKVLGSGNSINARRSDFLLDVINKEVSNEDNEALMVPFSLQEVKEATFSLHLNKAPGPDGFMVEVS